MIQQLKKDLSAEDSVYFTQKSSKADFFLFFFLKYIRNKLQGKQKATKWHGSTNMCIAGDLLLQFAVYVGCNFH